MTTKSYMPPPAGFPEVMALITFLTDTKAVGKKLTELNAIRTEINDRLETEQSLARTVELEADAKAKLADATKALDEANLTATRIRTEAESDVASARENLRLSREEWTAQRDGLQDELVAAQKALEARERMARAETEKAKTAQARADFVMAEAMKLKDEYVEKTNALKGIVGG